MQAGGRRFDPVWLHQTAVLYCQFVRENINPRAAFKPLRAMSDIVKRRSIRAFGAAVKGRGRRAISMHLLRRKPQSGAKSAKLDRIAVGSIL